LGAVVAVFVAVALTVIAPAGGTDYHPPTIRHCHKWPGLTEVHWNMQSLHEAYIANSVSLVTFEWDGAIGPTLSVRWLGHENFEAATPIGSFRARAELVLSNGTIITTDWVNCTHH